MMEPFKEWMEREALQESPCIHVDKLPNHVICFAPDVLVNGYKVGVYVPKGRLDGMSQLVLDMFEALKESSGGMIWIIGGEERKWLERMAELGIEMKP